ncbi:MAG: hypothetical protein ACOCXG_04570, partial [Nanoarchaeota archaeon]
KEEDVEILSIQEFIKQACGCQTNVLDVIHADRDKILYCSDCKLWGVIQDNRQKLYTKRMGALAGYCKSQSQKYSFKIEKYNICQELLDYLKHCNKDSLIYYFDLNFENEGFFNNKYFTRKTNGGYDFCGRTIQPTTPIFQCIKMVESIKNSFGSRVVKQSNMQSNIQSKDWKSISHAFRIGYQLEMIYEQGDYYFPLPQTDFLRKVKYGEFDYEKDDLGEKLQNLIDKCEDLAQHSQYPEKVDQGFWDNIILEFYK